MISVSKQKLIKMQGQRGGFRSGNRFKTRGCRALCYTNCSRVSVSSEGESLGSDHYGPVSSLGHYMVRERLAQMIKDREQEGSYVCSLTSNKQRSRRSKIRESSNVISLTPDKLEGYLLEEDRAKKLIEKRKGKQKKVETSGATSSTTSSSSSKRLMLMVAMEKCTGDPRGDFRQSMVEVILANRIEHPKDLRYLLNCYLSMNSKEHKGVILQVFHQVCTDIFVCCECN